MYALQANPTVVQNDEHILARGLQPGLGLWGGGVAWHSVLDYLSGFVLEGDAIGCMRVCVCVYKYVYALARLFVVYRPYVIPQILLCKCNASKH